MFLEKDKFNFYKDGFVTLSDSFLFLQDVAEELFERFDNKIEGNKSLFNNKYENAADLADETIRKEIIDKIKSYDLEKQISDVVGVSLSLSHLQLRYVATNQPSYMPLHRDVQLYNNKLVGPIPVPYKLIFYPKGISAEDCLKVVPRSHRLSFNSKTFDLAFNLILNGLKKVKFGQTKAVLFDTTILHHVPTIKNENARARLIITFSPADI